MVSSTMKLPMLTTDYLDRAIELYGDQVGVIADDGTAYTYREFADRINQLSRALLDLGLERGDRVAVLTPNSHWFMETLYATMQLGMLFVPYNFRLQPNEYDYLLNDAAPEAVIVDDAFTDKVEPHLDTAPADHFIANPGASVGSDWLDYEGLLSDYSADRPDRPDIQETDDATILYTSGTTGDPKGVVHTHRIQHYHALIHAHHMEIEDDDTWLWTSPMFHINGWGHIYTLTGIGGQHVLLRDFDPGEVFRRIEKYDVSVLGGAPTVLNLLLNHYENNPDIATTGEKPVRVETAASPPPRSTIKAVEEQLGWRILHAYGLTETGPIITTSNTRRYQEQADKYGVINSPGFACLNTRIRVVDRDGNDVPLDDETMGEIICQGNQVLDRYWEKPAETERAFNDRVEGWFHTGDIATMDENRMLTIVDRKKDVIISGGENISSIEVQDVLYEHPDIEQAAVIAIPHEKWGETPLALVVPSEGADLTEKNVIEFTRERLAHYKCPTEVEFRDALPQTATGKIQKYELRQKYWEDQDRQVA